LGNTLQVAEPMRRMQSTILAYVKYATKYPLIQLARDAIQDKT
jgi:hypothetical protein